MRVTVTFLGALQQQVGSAVLRVELPAGATYRDLLDRLQPLVESRLAAWAWDAEKKAFTRRILVSRNFVDVEDEGTPLADGDELLVISPIAGG